MATCELCGATGTVTTAAVAGTKVKVCDDCRDTADTETSTNTDENTKRQRSDPDTGPELVPDYGQRVRIAREEREQSQEQLAAELNIKESVLRRVEHGDLTPDQDLARTLEQALDITLYTTQSQARGSSETYTSDGDAETDDGATIGDVADIE